MKDDNRMKLLFSFLFVLSLMACSSNKEEETLEMKDIIATSDRYKEDGNTKIKEVKKKHYSDSLPALYLELIDSLKINRKKIKLLDSKDLPDRFECIYSQKFYWTTSKDSINFRHWVFKDSNKTNNAFYNWLDCFGNPCKTLSIGSSMKIQKNPILLLVREKDVYAIEGQKDINTDFWIRQFDRNRKKRNWKYIVSQPKKGKVTWFKKENDSLKIIQTIK